MIDVEQPQTCDDDAVTIPDNDTVLPVEDATSEDLSLDPVQVQVMEEEGGTKAMDHVGSRTHYENVNPLAGRQ